jgi:sugar phosphate isomerase/epimerase
MLLALDVAQRLGASTLQTTGGSAGGRSYEWAAVQLAQALDPVITEANRAGVRVALEPTRPQFAHVGFVHTLRDGLALAAELGLWLVPDTAHIWWEPDVGDLLTTGATRFAVLQVADLAFGAPVLERLVPGAGVLPLFDLIGAALRGGFTGPFELEIIGSAIDAEGYEDAIRRSFAHLTTLLAGREPPLVG